MKNEYSEITPYIRKLAELSSRSNGILPEMYAQHKVNRGLRDLNGNGVVTGLTEISNIKAKEKAPDGTDIPCKGELFYRGINVGDLVQGFLKDRRLGFEEAVYLLLFSELPDTEQLARFRETLSDYRSLPTSFVRDMILKAPGKDMMNILSRSVLALYAYDENPDDISVPNVLRQCLQLIAIFPLLAVYGYQSYQHYHLGKSLFIHLPKAGVSTAECLLQILRENGQYSPLEAKILDLAMVLHAEHGGGNNSTFTVHVVTSSGTDTYSAVAAALGSLKGPRHGGANVKVVRMFDDMMQNVNIEKEGEIKDYLVKLLDGQAFDRAGLIYGMGHAVYTKSDPRAIICKQFAEKLAVGTEFEAEYRLLESIERLAPEVILREKGTSKDMCANIDMYSGFVYSMMGIPEDLFTPLFACARMSGWAAHRFEEIVSGKRIIRPAYKSIRSGKRDYVPMSER